jgi:L-threonylcarbamoyladenylate synthase
MIGTDVAKAASLLSQGQLVAIPTETVYGLAANALDPHAVTEIYKVKNRPQFNPLILHCANLIEAKKYVREWPEEANLLAKHFWPGSISILLPKSDLVPDIITAGSTHVVVRVPNHPLTLDLLARLDFPLAAPSANISNTVSPTTSEHVDSAIGDQIGYVLEGGGCQVGVESTIITFKDGEVNILREGGVPQEEISALGLVVSENTNKERQSPGQLKKHYATQKPLLIVSDINLWVKENTNKRAIALLYEAKDVEVPTILLSEDYDLAEIANGLFKGMRIADKCDVDTILIEPIKLEGIGRAIADRLKRATAQ